MSAPLGAGFGAGVSPRAVSVLSDSGASELGTNDRPVVEPSTDPVARHNWLIYMRLNQVRSRFRRRFSL